MPARDTPLTRHALRVQGAVQGVGYRPFVYRLAHQLGLHGWVLNDAEGVLIEAQGPGSVLEDFAQRLRSDAPPLARVERVQARVAALRHDEQGFSILASRAGAVSTDIPPDTATCADCLAELFNPADRRWRHPFINCTNCGPRYTLTRALPYDRAMTSMAGFVQCKACQREYTQPEDRRFHAEPNACPVCGPQLSLVDAQGRSLLVPGEDPIAAALQRLLQGQIVAIKGLGGFHLACNAHDAEAVARLRQRKQRDEKPFALMCASVATAQRWVQVDATAAALLQAPERPIVLLPRLTEARGAAEPPRLLQRATGATRATASDLADPADPLPGIAPGLQTLGLMLPCTPIQFLLFHEAAGRPAGTGWLQQPQDLLLVMTSANPGGEPLVRDNAEALQRLQGLADAWLLHDRDIVARCDDSVLRPLASGAPQFIRRARGFTPRPIALARSGPPVLATGGWLKNTVCLTRGAQAFLSPHIGSLDNAATCEALEETVAHLCRVLDVQPALVAHDLHPDFFSTRFAVDWARAHGLPAVAVQHHHAHIAAVAAEHGVQGPLLGLALDGIGLGSDGGAWGGELLRVDGARSERLGQLAPLALPGGDAAAREPWRLAAAALHAAGLEGQVEARFAARHAAAAPVQQMLARGLRCPPTSSAGRWFDAAAGLLGVREQAAFEGQAAMLLEALAATAPPGRHGSSLRTWVPLSAQGVLDPTPLLAHLAALTAPASGSDGLEPGGPVAAAARLFHEALADGLARWTLQAVQRTGVRTVALGGGCFHNQLLLGLLVPSLQAAGLRVLQAHQAPPNDGGLALGQAWVALASV